MNIGKLPTISQRWTFIILFFLLIIRLATVNSIAWIFNSIQPVWLDYYFSAGTYILTAIVIWLNKKNLEDLNIDKLFVKIFIGSGILLVIFYVPIQIGIFIAITTFIVFQMLYSGTLIFGVTHLNYRQLITLFIISVIILFGPISVAVLLFHSNISWGTTPIDTAILRANLPAAVCEEALFRGMLWMFLKNLKLTERKILFIQALLFWISHYYYYSKLYIFWVAFPIISFLFGMMVIRSKSLTPSTISHFVINILLNP